MRFWSLFHARAPLWRPLGLGVMSGVLGLGAWYLLHGTRPILPSEGSITRHGTLGRRGTLTESMGRGRFTVSFDTLLGEAQDLKLFHVKGRLEEPEVLWDVTSPEAHRLDGRWTLNGPLRVTSQLPTGTLTGEGQVDQPGPALCWQEGHWTGLAPMAWRDLEGVGQGLWHLPAGWVRRVDGRLIVGQGPVRWEATGPGTLRRLTVKRLDLQMGLLTGRLDEVVGEAEGGQLRAGAAIVEPQTITWQAPITFQRADGWTGGAGGGWIPRPPPEGALQRLEFKDFYAQRSVPEGLERLEARGARWTVAGLLLEGTVRWEQPLDGQRLLLQAPRVLAREAPGTELPADLVVGEARAEGYPVLTWGKRTLSSPRMATHRVRRTWTMDAPVLGRSEHGTFSAGSGGGSPKRWDFTGPVRAQLVNGGELRGDRLLWEDAVWTISGRPATWTRLRERLSAARIVRQEGNLFFPEGLDGALLGPEGDLFVRADRGEGRTGTFHLEGRVECRGIGWRLNADRISVSLGPGHTAQRLEARGAVTLKGRMGEGWGEALELDLVTRTVRWSGRVRGQGMIQP